MTRAGRVRILSAAFVFVGAGMSAQEAIENWPAPALWSPSAKAPKEPGRGTEAVEGVPTPALHFVALNPCRLVDTRGNGFTGEYGPPSLVQGVPRNFVLAGQCGISPTAQAVSLNVTVTNTQGPGFILIYPQGASQPTVSTLNYVAGQTIANAAVVPLGAGFGITVIAGVSGADLILDTNGDYEAGVVTSVNGIVGALTVAPGSNISVTPSGQTLTIASTGGLPAGTANETLRYNGTSWVATGLLTLEGSNVTVNGTLVLPDPQTLVKAGPNQLLYTDTSDLILGVSAGGNAGSQNTVLGSAALDSNTTGSSNVAIGYHALTNVSTGTNNIGIGTNVGSGISSGSNNIYIGNAGFNNESGQIRIGTVENITSGTVIVGISGFSSIGGAPVYVNGGGRLGTSTASSASVKEDIRDIGTESDRLMNLRPVAFRYKPEYDPAEVPQYGLIAEEVAEVYPDLVECDSGGRPQGVRYHLLAPLLLNEVQNQRRTIAEQRAELDAVKAKLVELEAAIRERRN